jgi:serpin B
MVLGALVGTASVLAGLLSAPAASAAPSPLAGSGAAGLAAAGDAFASSLYGAVAGASGAGNMAFSPYSVAEALEMLYIGARGDTASQIASVLHLQGGVGALVSEARGLERRLAGDIGAGNTLKVADTLWVQEGLPLGAGFVEGLRSGFAVAAHRVAFKDDPEGVRQEINSLVSAETAGHIEGLLPPGSIDNLTRLVLANAVYMKAKWAQPFSSAETYPAAFHLANGTSTKVATMHMTAYLGYRRGPGYQLVSLPYANGSLELDVLLPDGALAPLERLVATQGIASLLGGTQTADVALALPRWRFTTADYQLGPMLERLGMANAFSPSLADLSGITTTPPPLYVSAVVHKAFVSVNESGTEAAAATGVAVGATAVPAQRVNMMVDRPFIFAIRDRATNDVLFLGRTEDPAMAQ